MDVAISSANLTVLIQERTLYGFNVDTASGQFRCVNFKLFANDKLDFKLF